jgi:hypothetical protein
MDPSWHTIRLYTKSLERVSKRVKDAVWSGNERDLIQALADCAEIGEKARRVYSLLQQYISSSASRDTHGLKDKVREQQRQKVKPGAPAARSRRTGEHSRRLARMSPKQLAEYRSKEAVRQRERRARLKAAKSAGRKEQTR